MDIILDEKQKKEDFARRLNLFQEYLKNLQEEYKLQIQPTLHITANGIMPALSINDTKYATNSSPKSPIIVPSEQLTKDKKSLENDKKIME